MFVACRSRLVRARSYLIVVQGSACEAASWTSRSGTPASKLVESIVTCALNTSTRPRGRQTTTFPCPAAVRGGGHGGDASAVWVQAAGVCGAARGRGAASEGGVARWDARPGGRGGYRCARRGAGWCGRWPGPGWRWPAPFACRRDAAAGRGCAWSWPVTGRGGISCLLCRGVPGRLRPVPGHVTCAGRDRRAADLAQWPPVAFPGVAAAVRLSQRAAICWPAGTRDDGCPRGLPRHDRRARGPPFPLIFREKK